MADEVHVSDIGAIMELEIQRKDVAIDISSYTTKEIIFLKPDNSKVTKTAAFSTDGTDGKMNYTTTVIGDLDQSGNWKMQGHLAKTGEDFKTEIVIFEVEDNL